MCENCGEKIVLQHLLKRPLFGGTSEIWIHASHGWGPCYVEIVDGEPLEAKGSPSARPKADG